MRTRRPYVTHLYDVTCRLQRETVQSGPVPVGRVQTVVTKHSLGGWKCVDEDVYACDTVVNPKLHF